VSGESHVECPENILHQRVVGMEQAPWGSGHSSEQPEFEDHLDSALRHRVWILGGPVWCQGLDSVILWVPSSLGYYYDSVS